MGTTTAAATTTEDPSGDPARPARELLARLDQRIGAELVVDVYVGYLRRKLGRERITSVRGMGYRLEVGTR